MEPITQFVAKYAPPLLTPGDTNRVRRLLAMSFNALELTPDAVKQLPSDLQVELLTINASIEVFYMMRDVCSQEVMDAAARVKLQNLGFIWLKEKGACNKLLAHLFDQALNNANVTPKEIEELISCKRTQQNPVIANFDRTQSNFENTALKIVAFLRYQTPPITRVNLYFAAFNLPIQIAPIPVLPIVVNIGSYFFFKSYLQPKLFERYSPRLINFLINHLPAKTFPIFFKVLDYSWWFSWIPLPAANTHVFWKTGRMIQDCSNTIFHLPHRIASWCATRVTGVSLVCAPALEKVANYSELSRFQRELKQIRTTWINYKVK